MASKLKTKKTVSAEAAANGEFASLDSILGGLMDKHGVEERNEVDRPAATGVDVLDFYNGRYFWNAERTEQAIYVGVPRGKMIGLVGYTGCGKTTLAVQIGVAIVAPYEGGTCFHFDLERAWSKERTADITKLPMETIDKKYRIMKPVSVQKLYAIVSQMIAVKKAAAADNPKLWVIDPATGERMMVPTVLIIDTVAALQGDDTLGADEMGSAMFEAGFQAKLNNVLSQRLAGMIGEANITIIWVNHIRDKIQTGPTPPAKRIQHLSASESIPGGHGFPQFADLLLKLTPASTLDATEKLKVQGTLVRCVVVKSRLSYAGRTFYLVLSDGGFDNDLSNLNFLTSEKLVKGASASLYLEDSEGNQTRKFAQSQFKKFYNEDEEFRRIAQEVITAGLSSMIPIPGSAEEFEAIAEAAEVESELQAVLAADA